MSTHIIQPSSNAVLLEVREDLTKLKSTVGYQQRIHEYQQRDSRKLNLIISRVKELENKNTIGVAKKDKLPLMKMFILVQ